MSRGGEKEAVAASSWSLVQYKSADSTARAGILIGESVRVLPSSWPCTMMEILADWDTYKNKFAAQHSHYLNELPEIADAVLVAPITYPGKLMCAGANYYSHAAEMGTAKPDPTASPFFFLKAPTTTILGPDALIPIPEGDDPNFDWEVELGVVIGRGGKNIPCHEARSHVAGYVVADDLSARGHFRRDDSTSPVFEYDWIAQKSRDGSCPIGPGITPAWQVPDIEDHRIYLSVNGELKQDSTISDLVVGIDGLVAAASELMTLEPGDIILTGTPAGVGMPAGTFLTEGDLVVAGIDGLGEICHRLVRY